MIRMADIYKKASQEKSVSAPVEKTEPAPVRAEPKNPEPAPFFRPVPQKQKSVISDYQNKEPGHKLSVEESITLFQSAMDMVVNIHQKMDRGEARITGYTELILYAEKIVDQLILDNENIFLMLNIRSNGHSGFSRSINISILAVELGIGMGMSRSRLIDLCTSAVLFDIELVRSSEIVKEGKSEDVNTLKNEITKTLSGSAYFKEKDVDPGMSDLIIICELYETLTCSGQKEECVSFHEAFKIIINNKQFFSKKILKNFIERIGPYPVGTAIKLSSGEKGWVVGRNINMPLRPKVRVVCDIDDRKVEEEKYIDLLAHPTIFIKNHLDKEDIARLF